MIDPYRRPKSFKPLVTIYIAAFYTGVIGSAITEQLYKVALYFGKCFARSLLPFWFLKFNLQLQKNLLVLVSY